VTSSGEGSKVEAVVFDERFDASTLHLLRERVAAWVSAAGMPEDRAMDVVLAVHELAANAVRHGAGAGEGPWPLRQGHGLWIVRAVADEFTASSGPRGSQVTAMFGWLPRSLPPTNPRVT
jgi:two-component sensor histidine kinase